MEAKTKYDKQNTKYHQQHGEHDNIRARCEKNPGTMNNKNKNNNNNKITQTKTIPAQIQ